MPWRESEPKRLYWTIGQVAIIVGISASAVRFWCDHFNLELKRTSKGDRLYSRQNLREMLAIYYLVEKEMYTLKGARVKLELWRKGKYEIPESHLSNNSLFGDTYTQVKEGDV